MPSHPHTTPNVQLKTVVQTTMEWITDVMALIKSSQDNIVADSSLRTWQETSPGVFHRQQAPARHWTLEFTQAAQALPSHEVLLQALAANREVAKHLNHQVGSPMGFMLIEAAWLTRVLLPGPDEILDGSASLEKEIVRKLGSLLADTIKTRIVVPLKGVHYSGPPINLDSSIQLDQASGEEVSRLLDLGIITPIFAAGGFHKIDLTDVILLRASQEFPKRINAPGVENFSEADSEALQELVTNLVTRAPEDLLQCLALLTEKPVEVLGYAQNLVEENFLAFGTQYSIQPRRSFSSTAIDLDDKQTRASLLDFWLLLRNPKAPPNRAYTLAMRRLSYAIQRTRPEDRIIDVMIAAEAVYLAQVGQPKDRGELRFRLSHRAAIFASPYTDSGEQASSKRKRVYDVMRLAYDARSSVVHGEDITTLKLKLNGRAIGVELLIEEVEKIVREALAKLLLSRKPVNWDALVFPASS